MTFSALSGATNRFRQFGISGQFGEQGSSRATFLGPSASFRLLKKLDVSYTGGLLNRAGVTDQHILTFNYELSPLRSFGGRTVVQNSDTNLYFFYHNSGGRGTDFFVVLGDPNAARFKKQLQVKWVFSFVS